MSQLFHHAALRDCRASRLGLRLVRRAVLPLFALAFVASPARAWMINEDYQQRDMRPASDFHLFLAGDVGARITGGGTSNVTNPFADPKVEKSKTAIGNTQVTFSGSNTIAQNLTANRHFGLFGTGAKPAVRLKGWSYQTSPFFQPVPVGNFAFAYDPTTNRMTVSMQNLSEDEVALSDAGFRVFSSEQPIDQLDRDSLPPSSFLALSSLDGVYAVGAAASAVIADVLPTDFIVTYGTLSFAGSSLGNGYNTGGLGTAGEWTQVLAADEGVAEPSVVALTGLALALLLLPGSRRRLAKPALTATLAAMLMSDPVGAWERGNHAGDWTKGGALKVAVDTPPGNAAQQAAFLEAVAEAMAEWNDAQKPFGGLKLELSTAANPDVRISWKDKADEWGATSPGKGPVRVTVESDDGINSRGVARILKHELGHVEGLGHSAASALMKEDAYSSTPGKAPSAADLNSAAAFINPTADDLAGKKALWGTAEKLSKSAASSTPSFDGVGWTYRYKLQALAGFTDPVTEFTIDLPNGVEFGDLTGYFEPTGWNHQFYSGLADDVGRVLDRDEAPSPSLLSFFASSPSFGLLPGQIGDFGFSSLLSPTETRAFTNSPSYDSDEFFRLAAPGRVPEPSTLAIAVSGLLGLALGARRRAREGQRL